MDDLVKQVCEKINVSPEQGKAAVETVVNFLKDKLPEPIASQIENAVNGGGENLGDVAKGLGGFFGN